MFRIPGKRMFLDWRGYLVGIGLVGLATILKLWAQPNIIPAPTSLPYILAVIITAIYFGLGPGILASILSVLVYAYFFIDVNNRSFIPPPGNIPVLLIFLLEGIIVSLLAANLLYKNEEAKQLSKKLIDSQEEEKKRISRELHDDTSPTLAFLGLELDSLMDKSQNLSPDEIERLRKVREKIYNVQQDIRHFSYEMHPAILDNLGLEPALESLVAEASAKGKIEIRYDFTGTERKLTEEVNLALYRITQEALNNVLKHSGASEAMVKLQYTPGKVILSISDNGVGFGPAAYTKGSLGLTSMRERANLIGAKIKLETAAGKGTLVLVELEK